MEIGDKEDHLACEVFIFSYFNSTYLGPFIVLLDRMKYTQHDLAPHIIWLGGCFIVSTTYVCQNAYPMARYTLLRGAFIRKQHVIPLSESPMAMPSGNIQSLFFITGVRCGFHAWPSGPLSNIY